MKRSTFLRNSGLAVGAALIAPKLLSVSKKPFRLVILHTNDTHSNIDPFPANHPKFPNLGGVSRRAKLIEKIRSEEEHVLLLDAGDIFQGTPYFNKFRGELEIKTMSAMKYDVVTLGNHDFDIGMEGYKKAYNFASFPVVNANYKLEETPLNEVVQKHVILKKGGFKIGIFGVGVNLQGLVPNDNWKGLVYQDPIYAAQEQVKALKKKGADVIICLSHLGYEYKTDQVSDKILAAKTSGIDLIIGGHTHTFLEKVQVLSNSEGKSVYVNQVGYGGLKLGRIDFEKSQQSDKFSLSSANTFLSAEYDKA